MRNNCTFSYHVSKKSGITGYGACCDEAILVAYILKPLMTDIYRELKLGQPICSGIDISYQCL